MYTIYALRKKYEIFPDFFVNSIIYIGMTKNLKQRLLAHKSKQFTDYIILDECETKEEAKNKEDFYIMSHDPILNKTTNKFGQHDTLENCLKKYKIKKYGDFIHLLIKQELKPIFSNKYSVHKIESLYHFYLMEEMRNEIG